MVPGSLPVSHRWAPLSAAVILSPLMGLFYHQVSADMVCFSVLSKTGSLWMHIYGSRILGHQLVTDLALATEAIYGGLCASSSGVSV